MKHYLKAVIYKVLVLVLVLLLFELLTSWYTFPFFSLGLLSLSLSLLLPKRPYKQGFFLLGSLLLIISLFLTRSIWLVIIAFVFFYFLYNTKASNELFDRGEASIHPPYRKAHYQGIVLVEPQSNQRTPLIQEEIYSKEGPRKTHYVWDDVNIVYFGGNNIIDFGNTVIPSGVTTVVVRKVFGRTRIILSKELSLKLNIASLQGSIYLNETTYSLTSESLRYQDDDYPTASRKINLIVSTCFGNVEVIRL